MIVKAATTTTWDNVGDLIRHLGVPAKRILLRPEPGTATEADVIRAEEGEYKRLCELIDGVLVEKAMGIHESLLAGIILQYINAFLEVYDLGLAFGPDGPFAIFPGRVRYPDVSFISWNRIPGDELPDDPIASFGLDLAIE